jgi:hypothetical protein
VLGTEHLKDEALSELMQLDCGSVVFTGKNATADALRLMQNIRNHPRHLLVLAATPGQTHWTLHSAVQPILTVSYPAPPMDWQMKTLQPGQWSDVANSNWPTPGDWFLDVLEKLGDQALKTIEPKDDTVQRVDALLAALNAVSDHEILHQQLAKAANALVR